MYIKQLFIILNILLSSSTNIDHLYFCDKIVGNYIDNNLNEVREVLEYYEKEHHSEVVVNYFYHMVTNCINNMDKMYNNIQIDEELTNEININ